MATDVELALLALDVYADPSNADSELHTHNPPVGWTDSLSGFSKPVPVDVGFYGQAYQNNSTGEVVIAYRGSSSLFEAATDGAAIAAGVAITQLLDAYNFYLEVVASGISPSDISFTGHSLGGALAGVMAAYLHKDATYICRCATRAGCRQPDHCAGLLCTEPGRWAGPHSRREHAGCFPQRQLI